MPLHADLTAVDRLFDDLQEFLVLPVHCQIWGPTGSGRRTLAQKLAALGGVVVELRDLRFADTVGHAVMQAAAAIGVLAGGLEDKAQPEVETWSALLARVLAGVRERGSPLILLTEDTVPAEESIFEPDAYGRLKRVRSLLAAVFGEPDLSVILISPTENREHAFAFARELPKTECHVRELENEAVWGEYADAARRLHRWVATEARLSPLILRLAVGATAIAPERARELADRMGRGEPFVQLIRAVVEASGRVDGLRDALRRLTFCRTALPAERLLKAVRAPDGHEALFTQCFGYGDSETRVSPAVATVLADELGVAREPTDAREEDHLAWADAHRGLDGAVDPRQLDRSHMIHWLEKLHHLAHAGGRGQTDWNAQLIPVSDLLIDRARYLSRVKHEYLAAAELYRRCVDLDPHDDYAWHYLGFNLDRAGKERTEARNAFQTAQQLDPTHPWWAGRLITFLIEQGRFGEADQAWDEVLRALDPDGTALLRSPNLVLNLHRWVISGWLDVGETRRARRVFDSIPKTAKQALDYRQQSQVLDELELRISDQEEVRSLGEAVRPAEMPLSQRWLPQVLSDREAGRKRTAWYPARVRAVGNKAVELVLADPEKREAFVREISKKDWSKWCKCTAQVGLFVEVGEYGKQVIVAPLPLKYPPRVAIERASLRHLEGWAE